MIKINIESNFKEVAKEFRGLDRKVIAPATNRAINKVLAQSKTQAKRDIKRDTGLKAGDVNKRLSTRKSTKSTLTGTLTVEGRPLNLQDFGARQTKKGVVAKAWGNRKLYRGAFQFRGKYSGKQLVGKKKKGGRGVKAVFGASAPKEFVRQKTDVEIVKLVDKKFNRILGQQIDYEWKRSVKNNIFGKGL